MKFKTNNENNNTLQFVSLSSLKKGLKMFNNTEVNKLEISGKEGRLVHITYTNYKTYTNNKQQNIITMQIELNKEELNI